MACPGASSRINPRRTHRLCTGCALLVKYSEGAPRLIDDGVATCPDRVSHVREGSQEIPDPQSSIAVLTGNTAQRIEALGRAAG